MRDAFVDELTRLAVADPRIALLTADLGYKLFDEFAALCPGRFLNMGVSEANMVSVAAGLALTGMRPVTYSIVPFATVRCLEQIRNDICNMRLPVVVAGVGGGYAYGPNGPTHHGVDDVAVMRAMPGMTVLCPCDPWETRRALRAALSQNEPAYLRLGRNKEPDLASADGTFAIGRPRILRHGRSVAILACGPIAGEVLDAVPGLVEAGVDPLVASVHTVKPVAGAVELIFASGVSHVFVVEEHGPNGGLAEALAVELADRTDRPLLTSIAAPDRFLHDAGSQRFMRHLAGIDAEAIRSRIASRLELLDVTTSRSLSVVIACYRDAGSVREFYRRLTEILPTITANYEIVYVNDASPDDAERILTELAAKDPRLVVINHTRNFGSQSAFLSGMKVARGDAVILMDGDLQDPPALIPALVDKWLEGYEIVFGIRVKREESAFRQIAYKGFYRLFRRLADIKIPLDAGDFGLMDRKVVDTLLHEFPERLVYLRGLRAYTGFRHAGVEYVRQARFDGVSTNSLAGNIRWAKLAIFSFSHRPLEYISTLAFYCVCLTLALAVFYLGAYVYYGGRAPSGFMTLLLIVLFLGSVQLVCFSIVAEYLGHIYEEIKKRPRYIVRGMIDNRVPPRSTAGVVNNGGDAKDHGASAP